MTWKRAEMPRLRIQMRKTDRPGVYRLLWCSIAIWLVLAAATFL